MTRTILQKNLLNQHQFKSTQNKITEQIKRIITIVKIKTPSNND